MSTLRQAMLMSFLNDFNYVNCDYASCLPVLRRCSVASRSFLSPSFFYHKYPQSGAGKSTKTCKTKSCFFMALRFAFGVENVDLRFCTSEFLHKVNSWEGRRLGMDLTIEHVLQKDLPSFLFERNTAIITSTHSPKMIGKSPAMDRPLSPVLERTLKISSDCNDPKATGPSVPSPAKRPRT